ncbi:hypothetical protein K435DRAFT_844997 [Dendrothele bispora CBS 962.96]|uniref:C2H2-type domain-containing protein n=1 Tax=Dendrothele bispora (strain CBS 962.96) TaxID=1314807 RepID=A0A4S8KXJ5_DENBC|nr:hypothetical protein K435DRAFT_844997 [Dendrothele bispora CBS 962.96]
MAPYVTVNRVVQNLLEHQEAAFQEAQLAWAANPKRNAMYFPTNFNAVNEGSRMVTDDESEDLSSWEFNATSSAVPTKPQRVLKSGLTPSQEIARRYRRGFSLNLKSSSSFSLSSSSFPESLLDTSSSTSPDTSFNTDSELDQSSLDDYVTVEEGYSDNWCLSPRPTTDPKIMFRQSRVRVLPRYREEAELEMGRSYHDSKDTSLPCPRDGCRDTLPSVSALTYHLHLHDVDGDCPNM